VALFDRRLLRCCSRCPRPGRLLDDAAVSALWDNTLAGAMLAERLAIDEEGLAEVLLGDLNQSG
jgi:hypothetical protein